MYAREIAGTPEEEFKDAQFLCSDCEASETEWTARGRCTGPWVGGTVQLRVVLPGVETTAAYPEQFATCPMGLLRGDLRPDEVAFALHVSHAAAAEVDKRWPEVPARLYGAVREWRHAESDKMRAEHEARMATVKRGDR